MQSTNTISTTQDDRIMAALSHVTVVLSLVGVIGPLLVYLTQKDRSRFVAFQALQAIAYQLSIVLFWFLGFGCYMASFIVLMLGTGMNDPGPLVAFPLGILGLVLLGWFLLILYGFVAAAQTLQGKDFRYLIIGPVLENYLNRGDGR